MIIGIGVDIVAIKRIEKIYNKSGERFLHKILTAKERELFHSKAFPTRYLAKRFAAKEAFAKAIGTGFGKNLSFQDVEIINNSSGKPEIFQRYDQSLKIDLSLSDEKEMAIAFVIASKLPI